MTYVVGCGWWCDGTGKHAGSADNDSSDETRMQDFFEWWYDSVRAFTSPEKIIVVDSASLFQPNLDLKDKVELVRLPRNFNQEDGSSGRFGTRRTGATRAFFLGAFYALMCDVDYFVLVEQDCLLYGKGIIERALEHGGPGVELMHGMYKKTHPAETCFVIVKTSVVPALYEAYLRAPGIVPEQKWAYLNNCFDFAVLPFGYGRTRPIRFEDEHFFAQHLTAEELEQFKGKITGSLFQDFGENP